MGTSRKKTYVAVLLLCVLAFGVDQLFLSGDARGPQQAAGALTAPPAPSPLDLVRNEGPETVIPALPFPFEVQKFASATLRADVFVPPPFRASNGIDSGGNAVPSSRLSESSKTGLLDRTTFAALFRLAGMISNKEIQLVIIDGTWIRIGESLRGCRLTDIVDRDAVFECFDGKATLHFSYNASGSKN